MTTLSEMKVRIADEVARSDLTGMIANAISDAIKFYQSKRFYFNETRELMEFDTIIDQEFYDQYDNSYLGSVIKIDYVKAEIGTSIYDLKRIDPEIHESNVVATTGQPWSYSFYDQKMRFYPIPNEVWTIRVVGQFSLPAPTKDDEKNNPWMIDGELLIRARAKLNLVRNVNAAGLQPTFDDSAMLIYKEEERDALRELKAKTNKKTSLQTIKPYGYEIDSRKPYDYF